jgi:Family of unknown function (DUF6114)
MSQPYPKAGAVLTIIGAGFLLAWNLQVAIHNTVSDWKSILGVLLAVDVVLAAIALVMGILIWRSPERRLQWAVIAIVFALPSLPFGFSGLGIGIGLIVVGGVLAIRYKAPQPPAPGVTQTPDRGPGN